MSETANINNDYGTIEDAVFISSTSISGAEISEESIYKNLPNRNVAVRYYNKEGAHTPLVIEPRQEHHPRQNRMFGVLVGSPQFNRYYNAITFFILTCITIVGLVSLGLTSAFYSKSEHGASSLYILIPYTIALGLYIIIFIFVAIPTSLVPYFRPNNEARYFCSANCTSRSTLYVVVIIAVSSVFSGSSFASLMQLFVTSLCGGLILLYPIGYAASVLNLCISTLSIILAIFTILTWCKDPSKSCSNMCIIVFIFSVVMLLSITLVFQLSLYLYNFYFTGSTLESSRDTYLALYQLQYYADIYDVVYYGPFYITRVTGALIVLFLFCLCTACPLLCYLEKIRYRRFNKISGVYIIILSTFNIVPNVISAIVMFIVASTILTSLSLYLPLQDQPEFLTGSNSPPCSATIAAVVALPIISGLANIFFFFVGISFFCFGCYCVFYKRRMLWQEQN